MAKKNYKTSSSSAQTFNSSVEIKEEAVVVPEEVVAEVVTEEVSVLSEFNYQMSIFTQLIYNVRNKGSKVIVQNMGYGDVYVSDSPEIKLGNTDSRIEIKQTKEFANVDYLYLMSASQPVISIIETK